MHIIDNVLLPVELTGSAPAPSAGPTPAPEGAVYPDLVDFATSNNLTQLIMAVQVGSQLALIGSAQCQAAVPC